MRNSLGIARADPGRRRRPSGCPALTRCAGGTTFRFLAAGPGPICQWVQVGIGRWVVTAWASESPGLPGAGPPGRLGATLGPRPRGHEKITRPGRSGSRARPAFGNDSDVCFGPGRGRRLVTSPGGQGPCPGLGPSRWPFTVTIHWQGRRRQHIRVTSRDPPH